MTDKELLEKIDVEDFLTELGIRNVRDMHNGEIQYSCPFPGHSTMDRSPSTTMSKVARPKKDGDGEYPPTSFYCFTCGTHGTAITFLAEYEGISIIKAKRFLRERFAPGYTTPEGSVVQMVDEILAPRVKKRINVDVPILDEKEVEDRAINWDAVWNAWQQEEVPEAFSYMLERGFWPDTLNNYDIGFDPISQRISIPARDEEGRLLGFKGRAWWPDAKPKYLALGGEKYGFDPYEVSRVLWGLHIAKRWSGLENHLYVIEGELNALSMHQDSFRNSVGISGRKLSRIQIGLIKKYCKRVTLWFDDPEDAKEAASNLIMDVTVGILPKSEKDAAECTQAEKTDLLLSAESAIMHV